MTRLVASEQVPTIAIGRRRLIAEEDLAAFLAERRAGNKTAGQASRA